MSIRSTVALEDSHIQLTMGVSSVERDLQVPLAPDVQILLMDLLARSSFGVQNLWGFIGASRSHLETRQIALKANQPCIIWEDDCQVSVSMALFNQVLQATLAALPSEWCTVQLGAQNAGPAALTKRKTVKHLPGGDLGKSIYLQVCV